MDRISKLNSQCNPANCEEPPNVSEFLNEKSPLKRANNSAIMLDSDACDDDTVRSSKKSKTTHLEME